MKLEDKRKFSYASACEHLNKSIHKFIKDGYWKT